MDAKSRKLMVKYSVTPGIAEALVKAGFDSPGKIRAASKKELETVPGVGKATAELLKAR